MAVRGVAPLQFSKSVSYKVTHCISRCRSSIHMILIPVVKCKKVAISRVVQGLPSCERLMAAFGLSYSEHDDYLLVFSAASQFEASGMAPKSLMDCPENLR
ncbi:hypothetical protein BBBOND_0100020 [Babesia bigemina]|uniref:Uncharacterized protein n=1 Tax=Babesia bigemina TaxID=5866 RepID=A0A061CYZ2_BABBI|nr:hypothetical protein BBBOND_0100020 [Babesia bigemina]CDR93673.1 hypothetical protein BBBOND_0100020 [Babesia bigemina]|eukprot:XP_012765859.1 hypothetical protein BBBOND_0100020 [Babesia bigemina]